MVPIMGYKITCEWENESLVWDKYDSQALYQTLQTRKINRFEKLLG